MSGYRSLKRVLGESNLERKCRWLFGICVGGLILLAFWGVDKIAEDLIEETAQSQAEGFARATLLDLHLQWWTWQNEDPNRPSAVAEMNQLLVHDAYTARVLGTVDQPLPRKVEISKVHPPADEAERQVLLQLREAAAEELAKTPLVADTAAAPAPA